MRTLFDLINGKSWSGRCRPSAEWSSPPTVTPEDYVHPAAAAVAPVAVGEACHAFDRPNPSNGYDELSAALPTQDRPLQTKTTHTTHNHRVPTQCRKAAPPHIDPPRRSAGASHTAGGERRIPRGEERAEARRVQPPPTWASATSIQWSTTFGW